MFDAKKLLDAMVSGTSQAAAPGQGGIGDILNQALSQLQQKAGQAGEQAKAAANQAGLGGVLDQIQQKAGQAGEQAKNAAGTLGGIAKQVAGQVQQKASEPGGLADLAKQILGQATSGVKDAAGKVDAATGAGAKLDDIVKQMSGGKSSADLLAKAKELVGNNPAAAAAVAGALGALVLGTKTGRSITMDAAKLGGMVLIGGLAYKAYQNYQAGKPVLDAGAAPAPAPAGSSFDPAKQSNEQALLYIRAMIAAAAADGVVSNLERSRIVGGLEQVGLDPSATGFLDAEFARPASIADLVAGVKSPEQAAQVYTAARVAIEPESQAEKDFLANLGRALNLDPQLVAHIDAVAGGVKS